MPNERVENLARALLAERGGSPGESPAMEVARADARRILGDASVVPSSATQTAPAAQTTPELTPAQAAHLRARTVAQAETLKRVGYGRARVDMLGLAHDTTARDLLTAAGRELSRDDYLAALEEAEAMHGGVFF